MSCQPLDEVAYEVKECVGGLWYSTFLCIIVLYYFIVLFACILVFVIGSWFHKVNVWIDY